MRGCEECTDSSLSKFSDNVLKINGVHKIAMTDKAMLASKRELCFFLVVVL